MTMRDRRNIDLILIPFWLCKNGTLKRMLLLEIICMMVFIYVCKLEKIRGLYPVILKIMSCIEKLGTWTNKYCLEFTINKFIKFVAGCLTSI